ncbi:acetoacetate decarboxylase family protein [Thalassotalea sp. M1531]|uniref:Acetoacetate decarboxylase family protein n=1 Tax=Thalassotalea algicola TaxID=2716224 RepID=A0A7Y0LF64_9GAMM|nr:acetoacetate decarboxylase family protein [Thalassotalea algicola]NMP33384.1 acetoacetate decarboxylase family protein [Thalassotalea algicola]
MQANNSISETLLDNKAEFTDNFFSHFELRTASQPLALNEQITKDYLFPTFYGDVSCAIGIFLCDFDKAKKRLPSEKMTPVKMPGNKALITISCYEYKNVLGVAPYNEIAMTIPIQVEPKFNPPLLPLLLEKQFSRFGYHVFHMPVTSLENQIRGLKIWGLPKVVDDIDIKVANGISTTKATDASGNQYVQLDIPTSGKKTAFNVKSNLYSILNEEIKQSATCFKANFNVSKNISRLWNNQTPNDAVALKLGTGPYADMLRDLDIDPVPFQTRHTTSMSACFDLPN